jgi:type II secretory pathway component PulF
MSDLKNKLIQSLIYPCFVLIAGLALIGVFTILVIPQLNLMFQKTGASIPWMTRMLMDVANLLKKDIGLILGAMIAVAIGLKIWTQRASGKRWWHQLQLQAPLIGQALSCQLYAQFSYALSNLIANGIPALNAMALLERSFPNIWVRENIQSLIKQVAEGRSLSEGLKRIKGFPPILADYLIVGEQTGDLASALQHAAARLEKEMNRNIQLLVQLIQPIVILFVGLLVGVLVISMMTGIFQTVSTLRLH